MTKRIQIDRKNPIIRIPAKVFDSIDKRKRKIPVVVKIEHTNPIIKVDLDWDELEK